MTGFKELDKCFIVAEISANHGCNFNRAAAMIKKAKECGVDAVKFQTYTPDTLTLNVDNKYFRIKHPQWGGQTLYQLYKEAHTPWKWFKKLKKIADEEGIVFFSTAFDKTSVDFLEEIGVPFHKISSFELVDLPLIKYAAQKRKPLILSTGMASVSEIKEALSLARKAGAAEVMLLKCISSYPAKPESMNLKTIQDMEHRLNTPIGISDHTLSIGVPIAAVTFGARMVEKHFTLSRNKRTPDHFFSLEPHELKILVKEIRNAEKAVGNVYYGITDEEKKSKIFRRSLFASKDINKGDFFTEENIQSVRPAFGIEPKYINRILKKRASKFIKKGTPLDWGKIDKRKGKPSACR
jgi:pseudaminic acid synthase